MDDFVTKLPQFILEGFNQSPYPVSFEDFIPTIEKISKPVRESLIKAYGQTQVVPKEQMPEGLTKVNRQIIIAQNTRSQIETYFEKDETKEETIEQIKEETFGEWLPLHLKVSSVHFNDHNVNEIQSHFRRQPWKEVYMNLFKDVLPFLKFTSHDGMDAYAEFKYLREPEIKKFVSWSLIRRLLTCPLYKKEVGCLNSKVNIHCRHW